MHVYSMAKRLIPFFLFFVTSITGIFGQNFQIYHRPELSVSAQINKDPRFSAKLQLEERGAYGFSFIFGRYIGIDLAFQFIHVHPSSVSDGYQYRGFIGCGPRAGIFGRVPFQNKTALRIFFTVDPQFASYYAVNTSFFFMGLRGGVGLELHLSKRDDWFLFPAIPVNFNLRRDLDFSIIPGVSVSFHHRLLPWPYKKGGN